MLTANQEFQQSFRDGDKPTPPARKVAVITCMDARIHPEKALGLEIGDAHMIRNAGGRASDDALRSLVISSRLLGRSEERRVGKSVDLGGRRSIKKKKKDKQRERTRSKIRRNDGT